MSGAYEHVHWCEECADTWTHVDEDCGSGWCGSGWCCTVREYSCPDHQLRGGYATWSGGEAGPRPDDQTGGYATWSGGGGKAGVEAGE